MTYTSVRGSHTPARVVVALAATLGACKQPEPGEDHTITNTVTNTVQNTVTVPSTHTVTNTVVDDDLDGGRYEAPLVQLATLIGTGGALGTKGAGATHMHTSEMVYREGAEDRPAELFDCSYTFAVWNMDDPNSVRYLAQGFVHAPRTGTRDPGCTHLALDEDDPNIVYTSHHGNISDGISFLSGWNLNSTVADPVNAPTAVTLAPTQLPMLQEAGTAYEAIDVENGLIWVALHEEGLGVFRRDPADDTITRLATFSDLDNAFDVLVRGDTAFVADGIAGLVVLDVSNPANLQRIGGLVFEGLAMDLAIADDTLYVAAESGGLVAIDVSDPTNPVKVSTTQMSGAAVGLNVDGDRLYLAAWNDARVYDISVRETPAVIGGYRSEVDKSFTGDLGTRPDITNRVLTVDGAGDTLFNGTWWVPTTFQVHPERLAPYMVLPEALQQMTFPGDLAQGESATLELVVENEGTAPLTVTDVWADDAAFVVTPSQAEIQVGDSFTFTLTFTASIGVTEAQLADPYFDASTAEQTAILNIVSDDPTQPWRTGYLVGNAAGAGVGDPLPPTTATMRDGSDWTFAEDNLGSVTLLAYWATFCPVCAHELPDLEGTFLPFVDQGMKIVALDADDNEALDPGGVWSYVDYMGLSFPMGIETSDTYDALEGIYDGGNPFPVDVLIDKQGVIRYISREYDPDALAAMIPDLLAE